MSLFATYFGANGWLLEFNALRVLVDPWLRGSLSFLPGDWLLKGELPQDRNVPEGVDLLLLTQGLADHAHPATLEQLPRDLPVIGSQAAIDVVRKMGFDRAIALRPGERCVHQDLGIRATAGARCPIWKMACSGTRCGSLYAAAWFFGSILGASAVRCCHHTDGRPWSPDARPLREGVQRCTQTRGAVSTLNGSGQHRRWRRSFQWCSQSTLEIAGIPAIHRRCVTGCCSVD